MNLVVNKWVSLLKWHLF